MSIPFELQMIHKLSGIQLFSYRFREDIKLEPTLISGFISAVITFAEELKPSEGKEIIKFIDRGDFVLQVESGKLIVGLLILSSKDYSFMEKLRLLVIEFERKYHEKIENWTGETDFFLEFEEQVKQLISRKQISPYHVPELTNSDNAPKKLDDIKWAIITRINGQNDINSISEDLDLSVDVVQGIISYFEEAGLVETHFKIADENILELTKKGLISLDKNSDNSRELVSLLGEGALKILNVIGTERSLAEIKSELTLPGNSTKEMVEKLVSGRYLEILPAWKVVLDKKAYQFTRSLEFIFDMFQLIFDESDNWLNARELERVKKNTYGLLLIQDEDLSRIISDKVEYLLDRNYLKNLLSIHIEFIIVQSRLEKLFKILQANIEREIGSNLTRDILCKVYKRLQSEYNTLVKEHTELTDMLLWLNQ